MTQMIFVNLPVADLDRSIAFYEAIGFVAVPDFTNEQAACVKLSDAIFVMLLTHPFWKTFTNKPIVDATTDSQVMLAISRESREAVDAMVAAAGAAGGRADCSPRQEHGFMYGRDFEDPDGHMWEPNWMDMEAALKFNADANPGESA